jgi:hypothetical protein
MSRYRFVAFVTRRKRVELFAFFVTVKFEQDREYDIILHMMASSNPTRLEVMYSYPRAFFRFTMYKLFDFKLKR